MLLFTVQPQPPAFSGNSTGKANSIGSSTGSENSGYRKAACLQKGEIPNGFLFPGEKAEKLLRAQADSPMPGRAWPSNAAAMQRMEKDNLAAGFL